MDKLDIVTDESGNEVVYCLKSYFQINRILIGMM